MTWLSENELAAGWFVELIGRIGERASGIGGAVAQFVRDYGQSIVGLIGVTFGFWRWWRYREHILHKRLAEYLKENDARLADGTALLIDVIRRPGPGQSFKEPLFVDEDLRSVLRERNWDNTAFALNVATSADWQLSKAIKSIERRLSTSQATTATLNLQLSSAYTIRGAIAASQARHSWGERAHQLALGFFRSALSVPGSERSPMLKELEAHQQRKLKLDTAEQAYQELLDIALNVADSRERNLLIARAKRYLAEIVRPSYPLNAWLMVTADDPQARFFPGALRLAAECEPLSGWERLEKADTHYFAAACANQSRFPQAEPLHLGEAEAAYRRVLNELSDRRRRWPRKFKQLRRRAADGLDRVEAARKGIYDLNWLPAD